jgi:hypothetical protein
VFWPGRLTSAVLAATCVLASLIGPARLVEAMASQALPALLFLGDLRTEGASFFGCSAVLSITSLVAVYAVLVDPWVLVTIALLTTRHLGVPPEREVGWAFANTVRFVFAVFPAGAVASPLGYILDLRQAPAVLLMAGLYFSIRLFYDWVWAPEEWLGVSWRGRD